MPKYGKSGLIYTEPKLTRPMWITDLDDLNYIVSVARKVCIQPDKFNVEWLKHAIESAEKGDQNED